MERMKQIYAQLSHYRKTGQVNANLKFHIQILYFHQILFFGIFHRIIKGRVGHVEGNV